MGKLIKEVILTANLSELNEAEKLKKETNIANAHVANPTYVPGLDPTPAVVLVKIGTQNTLISNREAVKEQLKSLTEQIHQGDNNLNDIYVNQWRPQTQTAIAGDVSKAKTLGYGVKGQDTGHTPDGVIISTEKVLNSHPDISKIDINTHNQHIIDIINNITGKHKLPPRILRIDVYGYTGAAGLSIADLAALIALGGGYLGEATKGKFINIFTTGTGKTEYYIAVYVSKKTKKPTAQSLVVGAIIN